MEDLWPTLTAWQDCCGEALADVVLRSLAVSGSALAIGSAIGLPLGAALAAGHFPGRRVLDALVHALVGLPTVAVGVIVYWLLSRAGPLGQWGWLYHPMAMIVAQTLIVAPLVAVLTRQVVAEAYARLREEFTALRLPWHRQLVWLIYDCRWALTTALFTGFARAISEIGAVLIVGGNIEGMTRVLTTAIAHQTAQGELAFALLFTAVLVAIVAVVHLAATLLAAWARRQGAQG